MTTVENPATAIRGTHRLTTAKAMVEAIEFEMHRDPDVFYLGEDVGAYGGIFGSTTGLLPERKSNGKNDGPRPPGNGGSGRDACSEPPDPSVERLVEERNEPGRGR